MSEISVPWPTSPLSEVGWRRRVEDLATEAEALVGRPCGPQQSARLAIQFVGLLWPALSPEVVAGSCRASLLLGAPGVLMAPAPVDQLAEVAERMDQLWEQAQAATVEAPVLLLEQPPTPSTPPAPSAPEPAHLELEPESVVEVVVEPAPEATLQSVEAAWDIKLSPPDASTWLTTHEVSELLGNTRGTIGIWRERGRFGAEGIGWCRVGKRFRYSVDAVEALMEGAVPPGFDQLLAEVQAAA